MTIDAEQDKPEVSVFTRYTTTVETLNDAFAFVMGRIDSVGADPQVVIDPVWTCNHDEETGEHEDVRVFQVVVCGAVDETPEMAARHNF